MAKVSKDYLCEFEEVAIKLLKQGFSVEELSDILSEMEFYATVRKVAIPVNGECNQSVEEKLSNLIDMESKVFEVYGLRELKSLLGCTDDVRLARRILDNKGFRFGTHRHNGGFKKGYKLPIRKEMVIC